MERASGRDAPKSRYSLCAGLHSTNFLRHGDDADSSRWRFLVASRRLGSLAGRRCVERAPRANARSFLEVGSAGPSKVGFRTSSNEGRFSSPGPPFEAASTAFLESCCKPPGYRGFVPRWVRSQQRTATGAGRCGVVVHVGVGALV